MTPEQRNRMTTALAVLPEGVWEVWTSNSYRRLTSRIGGRISGGDGGVLHGQVHRDGQPDLSMTELQLAALCELKNLCTELVQDN